MVPNFPFHPPYALMIGEAIRSLKEDGGSTELAISEYIKANFDGLPVSHHRLLPYYLTKLTVQGEFSRGPDGRFLIADDDGDEAEAEADPPFAKSRVSKIGPMGRSNFVGLALQVFDEMTMDDEYDGADPLVLTDGEAEGLESIPKRRGRPPKIPKRRGRPPKMRHTPLDVNGAKKALVLARSEPMTNKCIVYMKSAPKRRGRTPKRKDISVDPSSLRTNGNDDGLQVSTEVDAVGKEKHDDESKQVAKRCVKPSQRRRKSKKGSDQNAYLNLLKTKTDNGDVEMMQLVNSSSLGTYGNAVEPTINGGGEGKHDDKYIHVPKRRGRPPKMKHEFTDSSKDAVVSERDGDKPKRRRKSKKGSDQNADLNLLKTATDNGEVQLFQLVDSSSLGTNGSAVEPTTNGGGGEKQADKSKQVPPERRVRPPKMKHEFTDSSKDAIVCERDGDKPKRGRKSKKGSDQNAYINLLKTTTDNGYVQLIQLMASSSLVTSGSAVEPTINGGGGAQQDDKSKQVPKRRGRPPKMKHACTDSSKDAILRVRDGDKPKRRRKSKKISNQNEDTELLKTKADGDGVAIVQAETIGPNVAFPKRRGRPPKSKPTDPIVSAKEKQKDESIDASKRLGSLPKRKHEYATCEPSPKRCKIKENSMHYTDVELLKAKISVGDGSSIVGAEPIES